MARKSKDIIIITVVAALVLIGVRALCLPEWPSTAEAMLLTGSPVMTVTLAETRSGALIKPLVIHGRVVPREDIVIASELTGVQITEVLIEEGQYVEKGQVLARLDGESFGYLLDSLKADLGKAEAEFKRSESLHKAAAVSKEEEDRKKAAYLKLKSQTAEAEMRLKKTEITAPASGLVYLRQAKAGALTQASEPMFNLAAQGEVELSVAIPEELVEAIKPGQAAEAEIAGQGRAVAVKVRLVSPRISSSTRTAEARLSFDEPLSLAVNTYCTARFEIESGRGVLTPLTAIQRDLNGTYVLAVENDDTVIRRDLTIRSQSDREALTEGLPAGLPLVARAASFLREGERIARAAGTDQ